MIHEWFLIGFGVISLQAYEKWDDIMIFKGIWSGRKMAERAIEHGHERIKMAGKGPENNTLRMPNASEMDWVAQ